MNFSSQCSFSLFGLNNKLVLSLQLLFSQAAPSISRARPCSQFVSKYFMVNEIMKALQERRLPLPAHNCMSESGLPPLPGNRGHPLQTAVFAGRSVAGRNGAGRQSTSADQSLAGAPLLSK